MAKREIAYFDGPYVVFDRPCWQGGSANPHKLAFLNDTGAIRPIYPGGAIRLNKRRVHLRGWQEEE